MEETPADAGAMDVTNGDTARIGALEEQVTSLLAAVKAGLDSNKVVAETVALNTESIRIMNATIRAMREQHFHTTHTTEPKGNHGKEETSG